MSDSSSHYLQFLILYGKGLENIALQLNLASNASPEPEQVPHRTLLSAYQKVERLQDADALAAVLEQVYGWMDMTKAVEAKREAARAAQSDCADEENYANIELLNTKLAGLELTAKVAQGIISMSKTQL